MRKSEKEKILNWIFENHEHHYGCPGFSLTDNRKIKNTSKCSDGDSPYVNSMAFERFIKSFGEDK